MLYSLQLIDTYPFIFIIYIRNYSIVIVIALDIILYDIYYATHRSIRLSLDSILVLLFNYGKFDKFKKYGYNETTNNLYNYANTHNNHKSILQYARYI
jgi:hypothetical protein